MHKNLLLFSFIFTGFCLPIFSFAATNIGSQNVTSSIVWTKANSPYVVTGKIIFTASSSFYIEPGAEIIFKPDSSISIYGSFSVGSTTGGAVRFTADFSDRMDINDGTGCASSIPINVYTRSLVQMTNFEMKNGVKLQISDGNTEIYKGTFICGTTGLYLQNTRAVIRDSYFTNFNNTAIEVSRSGLAVSSSTFAGGLGFGISTTYSNLLLEGSVVSNFSKGISMGNTYATVTDSLIKQNGTGVAISDMIFLVSTAEIPRSEIFVSTAYLSHNIFENNYRGDIDSSSPNTIEVGNVKGDAPLPIPNRNPVVVIPGIMGSFLKNGSWVIDPVLHVYDNLLDTMRANGYTDGNTLFTFPYDWHQSNIVTAGLLKNYLQQIHATCRCQKIDLIAHSMGGLVARQYIESTDYQNDIDHVIFLGTPHLGSPSAYLPFTQNTFGSSAKDKILTFLFSREAKANGFSGISDYIQNLPVRSVRELLPTTKYMRNTYGIFPLNSDSYPKNDFLVNLRNGIDTLFDRTAKVLNISGENGWATLSMIFFGTDSAINATAGVIQKLQNDLGDNTVTTPSSRAQLVQSSMVINSDHISLPTAASGIILRELTGLVPKTIVKNSKTPAYNILVIQTLFPVHVSVIDPDGKGVGVVVTVNSSSTPYPPAPYGSIDGSFYVEDKSGAYLSIPNPKMGTYKILVTARDIKNLSATSTNDNGIDNVVIDTAMSTNIRFSSRRISIPKVSTSTIESSIAISSVAISGGVDLIPTLTDIVVPLFTEELPQEIQQPTSPATSIDATSTAATFTDTTSTPVTSIESTSTVATTSIVISTSTSTNSNNDQVPTPTSATTSTATTSEISQETSAHPDPIPPAPESVLSQNSTNPTPQPGRSGGHHHDLAAEIRKTTLAGLEKQCYNIAMEILEKLFGSAAKVRIIKLFLFNPLELYSRADIINRTKSSSSDVRKNLDLLKKVKFIKSKTISQDGKRVDAWYLDITFPYITALQSLLINIMPLSAKDITKRLEKAGKMKFVVTSGVFIQNPDSRVDLLVVGDNIKKSRLENAIKSLEADIGKELSYAFFTSDDFTYRLGMYDKLVRDILDFPHTVVVDKLGINVA